MTLSIGPKFPESTRYENLGELGHGATGLVFRARDTWFDEIVALKVLGQLGPAALRDIKREFRCAVDIVHPNLVQLHELEDTGAAPFFTMELVDGAAFTPWARGHPRDVRAAAQALLLGVQALHHHGLIHRDLKPSNVLVAGDGRVVVLDFGFAVSLAPLGALRAAPRGIAGTPRYLAPEVLVGRPHDPASDLYAVGLMLYEATGGELPEVSGWAELIDWKRRRALARRPAGSDTTLVDLAWRMIDPDPARRPTLDEALGVVSGGAAPRAFGPPRFVGRTDELRALSAALATVEGSRTGTVLELRGGPGAGKTRVVAEFLRSLGRRAIVLAGRCHPNERVAYSGLDRVIHELHEVLSSRPLADLADVDPALFQLFPTLRPSVATGPTTEDEPAPKLLKRAIAALRGLLARLVEGDTPLVLWIDDAQWIGEDGARLLRDVLAQPNDLCVLTVLCMRIDGAATAPQALASLIDETVNLAPITAASAAELLAGFPLAPAHCERIVGESAGDLHMLLTLARAYTLDPVSAAQEYIAVLEAQLGPLDDPRRLLERLAVAGRPVRPDEVPQGPLRRALRLLERQGLVRAEGVDAARGFVPVHERLRTHVLARLSPAEVRRYHVELANMLLAREGASPELVVFHLRAGGDSERAYPLALRAAESAARALAFGQSATLFRYAFELAPPHEHTERRRELAEALARAGLGAAAAEHFLALAGTSEREQSVELEQRAAEQLLFSGHQREGIRVLRSALTKVQEPFPRSQALAFAQLMYRALRLRPGRLVCEIRPASTWTAERLRQVDALHVASLGLSMSEAILSSTLGLRHLDKAVALGEPARLARAIAIQLVQLAAFRYDPEKTQVLFEQARELAAQARSAESTALVRIAAATAAWMEGRFEDCHQLSISVGAELESEAPGLRFHRDSAEIVRLGALLHTGRWCELAVVVPETLTDAARRGDVYLAVNVKVRYGGYRWLARDQPVRGCTEIDAGTSAWPRAGFDLTDVFAVYGKATCLLYDARPADALALLEQALPRMRRSFLLSVGFLRTLVVHLLARLVLADALARNDLPPLRRLHRLARVLSRVGSPLAELYATGLEAELAVVTGELERACTLLRRTIASCQRLGMQLEAAAAQARLGALEHNEFAVNEGLTAIRAAGVRCPHKLARIYFPTLPSSTASSSGS